MKSLQDLFFADPFWAIFQDEATAVFANLLTGKANFQDELL